MSLGHGASIVRANIKSHFDSGNVKSYSGTGSNWIDLQRLQSYTDTMTVGAGSESWMGGESSEITINATIEKKGSFVGYAEHPIKKWTGTSDASFVLYHFGTTGGDGLFTWYGNRNGVWGVMSSGFYGTNGKTYIMSLQYNDLTGGQLWVNGQKIGSRVGSGVRANNAAQLQIFGPIGSTSVAVKNFQMYNKELSDSEVVKNFEALRGRFGI